ALTAATESPMQQAVSLVDNSRSSLNTIVVHSAGRRFRTAFERIRTSSRCEQRLSGLGFESGFSKMAGLASASPMLSIDSSRVRRMRRRNISDSLIAMRVIQVEKEDSPWNWHKCAKAL